VNFACADSGNPPLPVDMPISITINPMLAFTGSLTPSGALPSGTVGAQYNLHRCGWRACSGLSIGGATGGMEPYSFTWAAASSSHLPPGLALSFASEGGCGGPCSAVIDGTPTSAGTYNFVVTVNDSESPAMHASATYSITVDPSP
jgi:hypothetical protein